MKLCFPLAEKSQSAYPTVLILPVLPLMHLIVASPFSIQVLLVTPIQLVVKWNLQGFPCIKCSKVRAVPTRCLIPVQVECFIWMKAYPCYMPSHLVLSHCSCRWSALLIFVESLFNTLALTQSCLFHIGLVFYAFIQTVDSKIGCGSFQSIFTRKCYLSWASLKLWGLSKWS